MHLHLNNKRQGPGSEETTLLALQLAHIDRNKSYRIADIGCGTGAQTITLAKALRGEVIAIDLFDEFLHQLEKRVQNESLCATVSTMSASMDALPFQQEDFDIIWSEGAVYNMGFQKGIAYWKKFLKKGGILAVSELSWITKDRPADLEEFWNGEYAEMVSIRPTTGIKPLYTTIATVTMNLIVSAAIVLLNPYVTIYISYKIPPFALSVHIPDVSTSIYVEVDSKVLLGLPFCDKAFVR